MSKVNENVLSLEIDGDSYGSSYAIHRHNIAGIVYMKMVDKNYTLWFHLIKPLQYNENHDGTKSPLIWSLTIPDVSYEDYLHYLNWFDNTEQFEIKGKI